MEGRHALCVLGCRTGTQTFLERGKGAIKAFFERRADVVVACGGRAWDGLVEADELARILLAGGVPQRAIVRERCSLDTRDNAHFAAAMLSRRGIEDVRVVTSSWHLSRATRWFRAAGLRVEGIGVLAPSLGPYQRLFVRAREAASSFKDARRSLRIG